MSQDLNPITYGMKLGRVASRIMENVRIQSTEQFEALGSETPDIPKATMCATIVLTGLRTVSAIHAAQTELESGVTAENTRNMLMSMETSETLAVARMIQQCLNNQEPTI